jgi:hypothetical protein
MHSCLGLGKRVDGALSYKRDMLCDDFNPTDLTDQPSVCHPVCTSAATLRSQTSTMIPHQDPGSRPEQLMMSDVFLDDTLRENTPEKDPLQAETDIALIIALSRL